MGKRPDPRLGGRYFTRWGCGLGNFLKLRYAFVLRHTPANVTFDNEAVRLTLRNSLA